MNLNLKKIETDGSAACAKFTLKPRALTSDWGVLRWQSLLDPNRSVTHDICFSRAEIGEEPEKFLQN
jgi:hypothetical protein